MVSDDAVEEIRSRLDIVELISEYVPLKRAGRNHKGLCPFHAEKTPSFMVSHEKQIFHCFGCGAGGDVFGFLMRRENLEFRDALEMLARRAGVELKRRDPAERGLREKLKAVQAEALAFWKESLARDAGAREYLKNRGIAGESIKAFSLGYAPPGWHTLLNRLKGGGYGEDVLIKAGLAARGDRGAYDVFRDRVIFPILDVHGEPIAFGGRVMGDGMPKYLNSPDTMLFKKGETLYALGPAREEIRKKGYAVVVEGYMDAIMCHQHGITNTVAPLGTALTGGQLRKLAVLAENVLLVFDGDAAGVSAARRSLALVLENGLRGKVLALPEGEDPDSVLNGKGAEHMRKLMAGASSPVEFILAIPGAGRAESVREAVALIARVGDPLLRDELLLELSEASGTRELTIREELNRFKKTGAFSAPGKAGGGGQLPCNEEVLLLSAALCRPEKTGEIFERIAREDIRSALVRGLLEKLLAAPPSGPATDIAENDEERALVSKLSLEPGFDLSRIEQNIDDCVLKINTRHLDEKIQSAQDAGDLRLLARLYSERHKLIQRT
jgi:DNA primase